MTFPRFQSPPFMRGLVLGVAALSISCCLATSTMADAAPAKADTVNAGLYIPVSRSELVVLPSDVAEVLIADPEIADVHVIGSKRIAFIGKKIGHTNAKLFDKTNNLVRQLDVVVGYDLPAIRKALHNFLPSEHIGVELVNTNIALTGEVSDASTAKKALDIVNQFITTAGGAPAAAATTDSSAVLNLMKISSGQQVMLRVRVGEVQRNALKNLGINTVVSGGSGLQILGGGIGGVNAITNVTNHVLNPISVPSGSTGVLSTAFDVGRTSVSAVLDMLETEGLFKLLAEPNLVAISGEKAEFLAGGQFPIPVPQTGGSSTVTTVQFKDYGVAVQFIPFVLSENRIRIAVSPEVSEIDASQSTTTNGVTIPALTTRRAKTTVELAPGESFMIAGLISDRTNSAINQIPGISEIPILGALFRSTSFQRKETELVIAVTPYLVDPLKSTDVKFPTDDFRPASLMEQFFYGSLGSMSGNSYRTSQTPSLEGPIGFLTD